MFATSDAPRNVASTLSALTLLALLVPASAASASSPHGSDAGAMNKRLNERAINVDNPLELAVDVRTPFHGKAETHWDPTWCAPGHWTPWNGDVAFDIWWDNGAPGVGANPNATCGRDVYLRLSPSSLPGGRVPDSLRVKTINVSSHVYACASQNFSQGGYQQAFEIWATYGGQEIALGWVLFAHLDNVVYADAQGRPQSGIWIDDPMDLRIGTVFDGGHDTSGCWGGCHVHMELYNYDLDTLACYQNICQSLPEEGVAELGAGSIVAKIGGALGSLRSCPVYADEEQLPCSTWDMDVNGCDRHGGNAWWSPVGGDPDVGDDTQDCAYYSLSRTCRPRGTSNCQAGILSDCDPDNDETWACSVWNGDLQGCDRHGGNPFWSPGGGDPDVHDDTQDCAYYFGSQTCAPRGTSNCATGILCEGAPGGTGSLLFYEGWEAGVIESPICRGCDVE